jgi:hypothetical protein
MTIGSVAFFFSQERHADSDRQMTARRHYRVVSPIFCNVRPMVFSTVRGLLLDAGATI